MMILTEGNISRISQINWLIYVKANKLTSIITHHFRHSYMNEKRLEKTSNNR